MGEISLPSELMAAMNVFGGTDASPLSAQENTDGGSFGAVLGLLMAGNVDNTAVLQADAQTDTAPEASASDILSAALKGEAVTELPDVFTEKGAAAFIKALAGFSDKSSDGAFKEDIWDGVSPEERTAFAELLYAAVGTFGDENAETDISPEKVLRLVTDIVIKSAKKSADDSGRKADATTDEAVLMAGMNGIIRPVQVISYDAAENADNLTAPVSVGSEAVQSAENAPTVITEDISEKISELFPDSEQAADITAAFEKLSDAAPEDIIGFCQKLADGLKGSVEVISPAPEETEAMHLEYGRQSVQGFMSRVNRHDDISAEDGVQAIIRNAPKTQAADIIPEEASNENEEVDLQIMKQIDLYRDIFSDNFSEKELSVKLSPEELGNVEVRIKRSGNGFEVSFTAQRAEAAELIADKASELERAMASRGIALKEMTVAREIVTNETDGGMTDSNFGGGLYGGAQSGENGSERHFTFGGSNASDTSEQEDGSSDSDFNREAKLWVSA